MTIRREGDFKPATGPAWWPVERLADWLTNRPVTLNNQFLSAAVTQIRDHVQLVFETGAAAESRLFATTGLSLTHLPRFGVKEGRLADRYAEITLAARVETDGWDVAKLDMLHPLGGERRLAHWQATGKAELWKCPEAVESALAGPKPNDIRMTLATPAVFERGWLPGWLDKKSLTGRPQWWTAGPTLTLVGVCISRWKAVSGWSLVERGPKKVKRLVPAGGVYFFTTKDDPTSLAHQWLQPVSDEAQDRNNGFGLAVWGTW